jgi:hypothetical protein
LTGSALVPIIGVPLLCEWLSKKGGDNLAKWATDIRLNDRNDYNQSALVSLLSSQLEQACSENAALVKDMGHFLHSTHSVETLIVATNKDKRLQAEFLNRLSDEVYRQRSVLENALASDLRNIIINTNGAAYIEGNLSVGGKLTQVYPSTLPDIYPHMEYPHTVRPQYTTVRNREVNTEGGAYIVGDPDVSGDFIGRDKITQYLNRMNITDLTEYHS